MKRISCLAMIVSLLSLITSSCDDREEKIELRHFATTFVLNKELSYRYEDKDKTVIEISPSYGDTKYLVGEGDHSGKEYELYHSIAEKYGDTCHREIYTVNKFGSDMPIRFFLATPLVGLEITSDIDWGQELPAGASLNAQLVTVVMVFDKYVRTCTKVEQKPASDEYPIQQPSMKKLIDEGVQGLKKSMTGELIVAPLSEIDFTKIGYWGWSAIDYRLVRPYAYLSSDHPKFKEPQTLTFKATFKDGSTHTATLTIE
ncbi:hypothetical protein [Porphyromonas sp.]|uniref:hypothetical protein n=1 Tax=Porphyromonas sp. TaxID=1924944 RepID=UPI0026DCE652|nr:hypothetical protein [Porphyromonas sp.]MDO4770892.1 hypothetical protein [Porphyromonas sp.]